MQGTSKRQIRAGRPTPKPNAPSAAAPRRPAQRLTPVELIERIVSLQLRQAPLDLFASESLPAALQAFGATAGALMLYHCEDESLVLVAEQGLSAVGRQRLSALRKGAADAWEIPLHGLLNRKAYIIERPEQHPFVPELVEPGNGPQVVNLATLPLYRGALPVGVLLLLSDRRPITETEILAAVLALDVLALALEPFLRRGQRAAATAALEAGAASGAPAALVCEPWVEPAEAASRLEAELAVVSREREQLTNRLTEMEARLVDAERALDTERRSSASRDAERIQAREAQSAVEARAAQTAAEQALERLRATLAEREIAIAERERALAALTSERDEARLAARTADDGGQELRAELTAKAREIERLHTTHAEALARLSAHAGDAQALTAELAAAQAQATRLREDREQLLAAIGDPGADPVAVIRALREQVTHAEAVIRAQREQVAAADRQLVAVTAEREALSDLTAQRDDLEARLQWALSEREEVAAAATARERRAVECLEAERRATAAERDSLHERIAGIERGAAEQAVRMAGLEQQVTARDEAIVEAGHQREALEGELATLRAELARLREDRERVLAVVDEPGAEPAAVIQALRGSVAALEAEIAASKTERAEQVRRVAAAAEEAEHRVAIERRRLAEAREAHRTELETLQAAHRTQIEQHDVARRTQVEDLEAAGRRALERCETAHQRALEDMAGTAARLEDEHHATWTQLESERDAAREMVEALRAELAARPEIPVEVPAAASTTGAEGGELGQARLEALQGELAWRSETQRAAERRAEELEHELSRLRGEGTRLREEHTRALADAEARYKQTLANTRAAHERALAVVAIRTAEGAAPETPMPEAEVPQAMEVQQVAAHRILEPDTARRAAIFDALATSLPAAPGKTFMVVNLLTALPDAATELSAAADANITIVGYAADPHGQSRIIGAMRCFAEPPTADEAVAAVEGTRSGLPRRVLTLSDDIDAFLPAKSGLSKAGHSVSMACDAKQATDLLAILRPDAVLVDFRTAPHAAAELLATITQEQSHIQVLLVHGDPAQDNLTQMMRRLLRPAALVPADLVRVCRATLDGPAAPARTAQMKPIVFERPRPPVRKPAPRRLGTRRR